MFNTLLTMYATRQTCPPTMPACYMAFSNVSDYTALNAKLHYIPKDMFRMLDQVPKLLGEWHSISSLQPFGFKHAWWFEDCLEYSQSGVAPAEINHEAKDALAYFNVRFFHVGYKLLQHLIIPIGALAY